MGLFGIFKSKSAPDELPELVTDEMQEKIEPEKPLKKTSLNEDEFNPLIESQEESREEIGFKPIITPIESNNSDEVIEPVKTTEVIIENTNLHPKIKPKHHKPHFQHKEFSLNKNEPAMEFDSEESYFSELKENIDKEITNIEELEDWYKKKFVSRDIVKDMKKHWEGKKNNTVIKMLSKNFQERISEKTKNLKDLEKEWQNIYFNMVEKEEEIKEQEKELKMMLADFVEICKRKSKENEKEED
ncbi:MAG: hypothetical protein WC867_07110 [Candidatus Pacearchaeota archaeon]|jgi:hypothetical protein